MSPLFVWNEGSSAHRGVWHLVEGEVEWQTVPEQVTEYEGKTFDHHTSKCDKNRVGKHWDYTLRRYVEPDCTCGHSGEQNGTYKSVTVHPEHVIGVVEKVACNQVGRIRSGGLSYNYGRYKLAKPGETQHRVRDVVLPYIQEEEPRPLCSRCKAKYDKIMGR